MTRPATRLLLAAVAAGVLLTGCAMPDVTQVALDQAAEQVSNATGTDLTGEDLAALLSAGANGDLTDADIARMCSLLGVDEATCEQAEQMARSGTLPGLTGQSPDLVTVAQLCDAAGWDPATCEKVAAFAQVGSPSPLAQADVEKVCATLSLDAAACGALRDASAAAPSPSPTARKAPRRSRPGATRP